MSAAKADTATTGDIERVLLDLARARGPRKTICPSEVSRALAGKDEKAWRLLMQPVKRVATRLAREGRVELRRKGRPVDPDALRGIYRIAIAPAHANPDTTNGDQ